MIKKTKKSMTNKLSLSQKEDQKEKDINDIEQSQTKECDVENSKKDKKYGKVSTHTLKVTKLELVHLRDLFSIKLPPNFTSTVSESLAETQNRNFIEKKLWKKISNLLIELDLPYDDNAPDFTLVPSGLAPVVVAQVEPTDSVMDEMFEKEDD